LATLGYPSLNSYVRSNVSVITQTVSMTLPKEVVKKIDISRGDISRSRYVLRIIEKALQEPGQGQI